MTKTYTFQYAGGGNLYVRVFAVGGANNGKVFDFADNTWKTLAAATTPYKLMTWQADAKTYSVDLNLSLLNSTGAAQQFVVKAYDNAAPASGDAPVSDELDLTAQFGEQVDQEIPVFVQVEVSVTSTSGNVANVDAWLEWKGGLVDLTGATCSITLREMGGGIATFTLTEADKAGATAIVSNRFELVKNTPGFTDDRPYALDASITLGGVTFTSPDSTVVIG